MPASSNRWLVWRMPSRPQSVAWLFARDITSNPIATLASTRTDPTSGAPRMEPPWRKNSGPKNKGPGTEIRSPGHDVAVAGRADSTHQRAGSRVDHDPLDGAHAAHVAHVELMALRGQAVAHVLREHRRRQQLPEDVVRI